jgi:type I restriction enzyme S subunit
MDLPPYPEQCAIARVLGVLDDKIEINRRVNQTLEEICRALFKFWFVDFGPAHAKAEGRWRKGKSLPGMPADMWDLWPREFEESEIGGIPKGWAVRGLLEIATLHSGGTPTTSERSYWGGGIPWVSGKDVSSAKGSFLLRTERTVSDKGIAHSHTSPLPARTVVITARGTVGALAILAEPMCISQTNYGLKAVNGVPDNFLRFAVEGAVEGLQQESYGTIFDTITTKNLSATQVVLPAPPVLAAFADRTDPLMNGVLMNLRLIETLAEARDTLLPKLLSGEIRVKVDS